MPRGRPRLYHTSNQLSGLLIPAHPVLFILVISTHPPFLSTSSIYLLISSLPLPIHIHSPSLPSLHPSQFNPRLPDAESPPRPSIYLSQSSLNRQLPPPLLSILSSILTSQYFSLKHFSSCYFAHSNFYCGGKKYSILFWQISSGSSVCLDRTEAVCFWSRQDQAMPQ